MEGYQVVIKRASSVYGCAIKHAVELDGFSVGTLKNGETLTTQTTVGAHNLTFLNRGKVDKTVSLLIGPDTDATRLFVTLNAKQKIEIRKENETSQSGTALEESPRKKRKHPLLTAIGLGLILFIAIGIIASLGNKTSSTSNETTQSEAPTDEEKAAAELEKASAEFQAENYSSAIEICSKISADYPNTEIAADMNTYLEAQYAEFPHFSAKGLMREYDANIVNADEKYTDVVMVVSGTVSNIGKTNGDSNLTVMLNSDTYFYGVQLNFQTSQTESVAALSVGDSVSVLGKCTGKSGKQLLVLDGNNVMIEDCYFIG